MAQTRALKTRIKAVKSTRQITKAMELVAASKMRRAQETAMKSRAYSELARQILTRISELTDVSKHPLYKQRVVKTHLIVTITSDRGLAGAYNSNILRQLASELQADKVAGVTSQVLVVGKQGSKFVGRLKDVQVIAAYDQFPENPTPNDIRPILNTLVELYTKKSIDAADVLFTSYKSSISHVELSGQCKLAANVRLQSLHL